MAYTNLVKCVQRDAPAGMRDSLGKLAEVIQGGMLFIFHVPVFTGWTKDGTAKAITGPGTEQQFPFPVEIVYAACGVGTAPGSGKTLTVKMGATTLGSIADTNTFFETKGSTIGTLPAYTDLGLTIEETAAGAGANAFIYLICRPLPPMES